jgi:acyl-CoA thioester hydrolase
MITTVRVRYAETDQMGVAYHANYLVWMEIARTELLRSSGLSYKEMEARGFMLPVSKVGVSYRSSARYDDEVEIESNCAKVMVAGLRIEYLVRRRETGELLAEGFTEHACVDSKAMRVTRLPDFAREAI